MANFKIGILLIAGIVTSCLPFTSKKAAVPITVEQPSCELDGNLNQPSKDAFVWAASKWNTITIKPITYGVNNKCLVLVALGPEPGYWPGWADHHGNLRIAPYADEKYLREIALHELGHLLGLRHGKSGVMCGSDMSDKCSPTGLLEFNDEDMAECRRIKACKE